MNVVNSQDLGEVIGIICAILALFGTILSIGIQYGIYTSFKTKVELDMERFESRIKDMEITSKNQDIKYAVLLEKVENIDNNIKDNFERIFTKLDTYDDNIKDFFEKYSGILAKK